MVLRRYTTIHRICKLLYIGRLHYHPSELNATVQRMTEGLHGVRAAASEARIHDVNNARPAAT